MTQYNTYNVGYGVPIFSFCNYYIFAYAATTSTAYLCFNFNAVTPIFTTGSAYFPNIGGATTASSAGNQLGGQGYCNNNNGYTTGLPVTNQALHVTVTINALGQYTTYLNGTLWGSMNSVFGTATNMASQQVITATNYMTTSSAGFVFSDVQVYLYDMSQFGGNLFGGSISSTGGYCLSSGATMTNLMLRNSTQPGALWTNGPANATVCPDLAPAIRCLSTTSVGCATGSASGTNPAYDATNAGYVASGVNSYTVSNSFVNGAFSASFWLKHNVSMTSAVVLGSGNLKLWVGLTGACVATYSGAATTGTNCNLLNNVTSVQNYLTMSPTVAAYTSSVTPTSATGWNHFLWVVNSTSGYSLFINGVPALYSSVNSFGSFSTFYPSSSLTMSFGGSPLGTASSNGELMMADIQIYSGSDLSSVASNLFNGYDCLPATFNTAPPPPLQSVAPSTFSPMPWAQGPPFLYSCADAGTSTASLLTHRMIGGTTNVTNSTADLINAGAVVGLGTANVTAGSGGLIINSQYSILRTPPTDYAGATGVTIAFWMLQNIGANFAPVVTLGDGIALYMSSTYGTCVGSSSVNPGATSCAGLLYSLTNASVPAITNAWTHFVFVASQTAGYSLFQNGILVQFSNPQTTLLPWSEYYGNNIIEIGAVGSAVITNFTIGDLQVGDMLSPWTPCRGHAVPFNPWR